MKTDFMFILVLYKNHVGQLIKQLINKICLALINLTLRILTLVEMNSYVLSSSSEN